jgi:hypothetical protein
VERLRQAVEAERQRGAPPPGYVDPETGTPSAYAARVGRRMAADAFFMDALHRVGLERAAELACDNFGHDARGGLCERCGSPSR